LLLDTPRSLTAVDAEIRTVLAGFRKAVQSGQLRRAERLRADLDTLLDVRLAVAKGELT
jgi:hypothetical protein